MLAHTISRAKLRVLLSSAIAVLLGGSCGRTSSTTTDAHAPTVLGVKMASSPDAAAVVARARLLKLKPAAMGMAMAMLRHSSLSRAPSSALVASEAIGAKIAGAVVRADFSAGVRKAEVVFPAHADGPRELTHVASGARISIELSDATAADAEYANGYLVYRGALNSGGDLIHRPTRNGFEDYFVYDKKPAAPHVGYDVRLPPVVAGLRLTNNILELLNAKGTPLIHVSPPFLIDASGKTIKAILSVSGCAVDQSAQPPWKRKPKAPGTAKCHVDVVWDDSAIQYPAVLDPTWTAAGSMAIPRSSFQTAVLSNQNPNYVVAVGGYDSAGNPSAAVEFFDPDSGTWSPGPAMNVPRYWFGAVTDGTQIFVAGGYSNWSPFTVERSTEFLSQDSGGVYGWSTSQDMQITRIGFTPVLSGGNNVLIAGGDDGTSGTALSSCEMYDLYNHVFGTEYPPPDMSHPREDYGASLAPDGQSVIVAGGFNDGDGDQVLASAELFINGAWQPLPDMPSPHGWSIVPAAVALPDGRVMMAGGWSVGWEGNLGGPTQAFSNQAELYTFSPTPPYGSWSSAGAFSATPREGFLATVTANGSVLLGPGVAGATLLTSNVTTEASLFDVRTGSWSANQTSVGHDFGGLATTTKSNGARETIVFGGYWDQDTLTDVTEVFGLDPVGSACSDGSTCVSGVCGNGVCLGGLGEPCTSGTQCVSSYCTDTGICAYSPQLAGHWQLNETSGTVAYDVSGHHQNATMGGDTPSLLPSWGTDRSLVTTGVDGGSSYVTAQGAAALETSQMSFELWLKASDSNSQWGTPLRYTSRDWQYGESWSLSANAELGVSFQLSTSTDFEYVGTPWWDIADGNWHHVAGTYDGAMI
ncbi:MAG: Kelch-like protein 1, partial [bacterium]|nr:Kelch-like protein 1 [bacterium]